MLSMKVYVIVRFDGFGQIASSSFRVSTGNNKFASVNGASRAIESFCVQPAWGLFAARVFPAVDDARIEHSFSVTPAAKDQYFVHESVDAELSSVTKLR